MPLVGPGIAQANLPLYTDNLVNGFQNWSWATVNLLNAVRRFIRAVMPSASPTAATTRRFVLNIRSLIPRPTPVSVFGSTAAAAAARSCRFGDCLDGTNQAAYPVGHFAGQHLAANNHSAFLAGRGEQAKFDRLLDSGQAQARRSRHFTWMTCNWWPRPTPALVHLGVDAGQTLRTVDARQFGLNTATWDGSLGNSSTLPMLQQIGCLALRWPGGSTSDDYHWASDPTGNATFHEPRHQSRRPGVHDDQLRHRHAR